MKSRTIHTLLFFVLALALSAWGDKKFTFNNNASNPAAAGYVNVSTDHNGNNHFSVYVFHLAKPQELAPAKTVYVVWVQPKGEPPQNMGKLKVDHDLEGGLKGATPEKEFDMFITAEDNGSAQKPSGQEILRTRVKH